MTDSFVTQCPHCQTSFRVNHSQLAVARGVVRCGACLQVFNAAQQLLDEQAAQSHAPEPVEIVDLEPGEPEPSLDFPPFPDAQPEPRPVSAAPAPATPEPARPVTIIKPAPEPLWIHDDLDLDSLDLDEELAKLEAQELQMSQQLLARQRPAETKLAASREHVEDESWAEALLNDEAAERQPQPRADAGPAATRPDDGPREPTLQGPFTHHPEDRRRAPLIEEPPLDERTEPSISFGDGLDHDDEFDMPRHVTPAKARNNPRNRDEPTPAVGHAGLAADAYDVDEHDAETGEADLRGRNEPGVRDESLFNLYDDPLQLDWQERRSPWGRRILWSLLILLAAGGLLAQYVAYHFDELSRQDQYRPWFQELCPEIGCTLPSKVDIKLIRSSNLVVRSHPDFAGALVVDAILYNRAPFSQPFPLLELRFADASGHLIASRRFKPGEYLSGELAGQDEMPPQTPIHISLDILDPGPKAVNYSLSFHSPE